MSGIIGSPFQILPQTLSKLGLASTIIFIELMKKQDLGGYQIGRGGQVAPLALESVLSLTTEHCL